MRRPQRHRRLGTASERHRNPILYRLLDAGNTFVAQ